MPRFPSLPAARVAAFVVITASVPGLSAPAALAASIAGLQPDRRPDGAPGIGERSPPSLHSGKASNDAQSSQRLRGISEPLPPGLDFLKDQGAWYTPFGEPGMSAPYDLRGWHRKP